MTTIPTTVPATIPAISATVPAVALPAVTAVTAGSMAETRWTVQERAWKQDLPDLPDDVIALLAPPVVVIASTTAGRTVPRAVVQVA